MYKYVRREVDELVNYVIGDVRKKPYLVVLGEVNMSNRTNVHVPIKIRLVKKCLVERATVKCAATV